MDSCWEAAVDLDWQSLGQHVAAILRCADCRPTQEWPHAPWVGLAYKPGGVVLLAQNPSDTRQLTQREESALTELLEEGSTRALQAWSTLRISGERGSFPGVREWGQWKGAIKRAVGPCLPPDQTAWLNVVNRTGTISGVDERHGRAHLRELLAVLRPRAVVTRYDRARDALMELPGPWQHYDPNLLHLSGKGQRRTVNWSTGAAVHRVLHEQFALPYDATCSLRRTGTGG